MQTDPTVEKAVAKITRHHAYQIDQAKEDGFRRGLYLAMKALGVSKLELTSGDMDAAIGRLASVTIHPDPDFPDCRDLLRLTVEIV